MSHKPKIRLFSSEETRQDPVDRETIEHQPQKTPTSLSFIMEQKTWENAQLRNELKYHQRKHGASMYLLQEVKLVVESLQKALVNFQKLNTEYDRMLNTCEDARVSKP